MAEKEILDVLDNSNDGYYCSFVELGHVYSYLIDARLNVFRAEDDRWAIAIERVGYNPRGGAIVLEINYYGNCLINLEYYNNRPTSSYSIYPIDFDTFLETMDGERLKVDAKCWLVRGQEVSVRYTPQDYIDAGIDRKKYEPNEICGEEIGRLVVLRHRDLFRATDDELYKSIPADLKKILVVDEWFHQDFSLQAPSVMTDENLRETYADNKSLAQFGLSFEDFVRSFREQQLSLEAMNREQWENNRPSSYETWPMIASVIAENNPLLYRPTLPPNTHWIHWPDSGSL